MKSPQLKPIWPGATLRPDVGGAGRVTPHSPMSANANIRCLTMSIRYGTVIFMQVFAAMSPELPLAAVPSYAGRVERLGFDGLHVAETVHDSMAVALLAVEHTTRITVRTAVTLAFVRSPTLVAYTAWDLAILSNGRFELGLGTQIRQNIEDR